MEYTKQEMLDVLKRHEGTDPECDCACPLSGHSTEMLIRFVGVQNEIPNRLIECAIILLRQFNQKQCLMGVSRFSIAAGIIYASHQSTENITQLRPTLDPDYPANSFINVISINTLRKIQ